MSATKMTKSISKTRLFLAPVVLLLAVTAYAAAPGIAGTGTAGSFSLTAQTAFLNQPDGSSVYAWGYGCATGTSPTFLPQDLSGQNCPTMQVPGPTLIVTEGQTVTVTLTNGLPTSAGNTSILFPGFNVTATGGVQGLLTQEAAHAGTVTYTFVASSPGTHSYYSGTQSDLQIEMGLYGAIIVLPTNTAVLAECSGKNGATSQNSNLRAGNLAVEAANSELDFRLSSAAYDTDKSCYDREYLFQFAEVDANIH